MKISTYNQMFGLNGASFFRNLMAHWNVHFYGNVEKIKRKSDIQKTLSLLENTKSDVIGVCEIIGQKQEDALIEGLKRQGFSSFLTGSGRKTKHEELDLRVLLAAKGDYDIQEAHPKDIFEFPENGGEVVHGYIPKCDLDIIMLHLLIPRGKRRQKTHAELLQHVQNIMENERRGKNILLMGDLNIRYKTLLKKHSYFKKYNNFSASQKTWSFTWFLRSLFSFDFDHILGEGFTSQKTGLIWGESDHALLWAEIQ